MNSLKCKKNKKRYLFILTVLISLGNLSPVNAYFTDQDFEINEVTVGKNETTIIEEFPEFTPIPHQQNSSIQKTVQVYSPDTVDNVDCYVRVRVSESNSVYGDAITYQNIDTDNWEYDNNDHFYYYKHVLKPGEYTTPLFTAVKVLGTDVDSTEAKNIQQIFIDVYEESIQAANATDYRDAWFFSAASS